MSELIFLILLFICFAIILILHHYLDKRGLYFAIAILSIITFILTFKITVLFRMNINLGIIPYIMTLTIIYIYIIKYGIKDIKKIIAVSLITNILIAIFISIMNCYIPAIIETISINIEGTFEYNYKILIAYPIIMLLSQLAITKLYNFVSALQNNMAISLILCYIITGLLYTVIFYILCYINVISLKESIFIGITTYIIGLVETIMSIIFIKVFIESKKVSK